MDYEKIGKFIQQLRKEKNLTQKDLAEYLSVTIQAISKWERGLGCPDISLLRPLSEKLEISISELLNGEKIKKENILEKVDDLLMKNLETSEEKRKKDRIAFLILIIGIFFIFYSLTINIYGSLRILTVITIILGIIFTLVVLNKKIKLWHLIIPILVFGGLFLFDYIAVSIYHREPIAYYKIITNQGEREYYKRYDGFFYTAYQCMENEIYEIGPKKIEPMNYCREKYNHTITKSASITSKEGYIYFLGISTSYEKNYMGNNHYFIEGFDFSNLYESEYMKNQINFYENKEINNEPNLTEEEIETRKNRLSPHGDHDLSYAPEEVREDLRNIYYFLNEKKYNKKITIENLNELILKKISKEEVVELFNKVIENGHNDIQYEVNRKIETINNKNYEVIYMIEDHKITHVKINIKDSSLKIDNDYLKELENKIIEKNKFDIQNEIQIKKDYEELITMLSDMKIEF